MAMTAGVHGAYSVIERIKREKMEVVPLAFDWETPIKEERYERDLSRLLAWQRAEREKGEPLTWNEISDEMRLTLGGTRDAIQRLKTLGITIPQIQKAKRY